MRLLFALLLLSISIRVNAETYKLETKSILQGEISFSYLKVIDQRYDTAKVGLLRAKAFNRTEKLITDKELATVLSDFALQISGNSLKRDDTLLLVLHDYYIQHKPNGDNIAVFHFDGEFFLGGDNEYQYVSTIDSLYEARLGNHTVQDIISITADKMFHIMKEIAASNAPVSSNPSLNVSEAAQYRKALHAQFPLYSQSILKQGLYLTPAEFLMQTPANTFIKQRDYFSERRTVNCPRFYYTNRKHRRTKRIRSFFVVVSKDGNIYESNKVCNRKLLRKYGQYVFRRPFPGLRNKQQDIGAAAGYGGAFGGVIMGVISGLAAEAVYDNSDSAIGMYEARLDPVSKIFYPIRRYE